jgi:hypothetical protein
MENLMEENGNKFIVQFSLSSSDRWIDSSRKQEFRRLVEELGDRTPWPVGQHITTGGVFL